MGWSTGGELGNREEVVGVEGGALDDRLQLTNKLQQIYCTQVCEHSASTALPLAFFHCHMLPGAYGGTSKRSLQGRQKKSQRNKEGETNDVVKGPNGRGIAK